MLNSSDQKTRLPGILCETRMPNLSTRPLQLDVAAFVGLAERGPLDVPVMIEDFSQYRLIFGGDLPLARIEGRPLFAHLPRTVEAFFKNGGQRCYVVRVAGKGHHPSKFQIPGLLHLDNNGAWQPVVVPAAWSGGWSELVSLATSLQIRSLHIRVDPGPLIIEGSNLNTGNFELPLRLPTTDALQDGDLLRLHLHRNSGENYHLYIQVAEIEKEFTLPAIQLSGNPILARPAGSGTLFRIDPDTVHLESVALLETSGWVNLPFAASDFNWSNPTAANNAYVFSMPLDATVKIETGALLRIDGPVPGQSVFITAGRIHRGRDPNAGGDLRLFVNCAEPLQIESAAAAEPYELIQVDVLSFDLAIRESETRMENWPAMRFGSNGWRSILQPAIESHQIDPAAFTVDHFTPYSLRLGAAVDSEEHSLLPIGMGPAFNYAGPQPDPLAMSKDGLDTYDPSELFVDPDFQSVGIRSLMSTANDLLHLSPNPRRLRGMHSLIPVEEIALVAVPDLAHIGWEPAGAFELSETEDEPEEPQPPAGFHECPTPEPVVEGDAAAPVVMLDSPAIAADPSKQAWLENLPEQKSPADHDIETMLEVQRAIIRMCAARADMVALLSLPQDYDAQAASQWHQAINNTPAFFDGDPLSYAILYHGWPAILEESTPWLVPLRYLPPDGFVCGMIAAREIQRGAWIAPANVPLQGVIGLQPDIRDDQWASLFQRQLNIIRHQPGHFSLLSAMTLAREHSLRQINVRRLLILLRKLALREGQRYVFETNNERFRKLVQTYFENILNQILENGGLQAYQVVTDEEINTKNDYDNGRFLIALKVAPTLPIEFITITMLRSGDDGIRLLER